jgi:hypothetical protein
MSKCLHGAALCPALLAALACGGRLAAQAPRPAAAPAAAAPRLRAAALVGAVKVDGRLDEAAWAAADSADAFTQSYPHPGAAPIRRTVVRVLYGPDALYAGLRMYDPHPDSIAGQLARRDAIGIYSDWVHVMVDTYHDRRTAFRFSLNPRGVQKDVYESNDIAEDLNWDAVWQGAARVDSLGWTAEIRVPFSQLRFGGAPPAGGRVWGFQVMRDVARDGERDSWSPWTRNSAGFVSRFGDLAGLDGVKSPRRLELLPYVSSRLTRARAAAGDPFHGPGDVGMSAGADLKAGLPGGLTLTATANPDFGQVEVDPAVVNLSAYETFFPEKRPFFVEGSDVFSFGQVRAANTQLGFQRFFYSRRIGRAPQQGVTARDAAWVDAPSTSTIFGAAKVSGRANGWTVGAMDALTAREQARFQTSDGARGTQPVEPMTNYFVGRLRRDFDAGATVLGAMATATNRAAAGPAFAGLRSGAWFGGIDGEHAWANRSWYLSGYLGASRVSGAPLALRATQLGSAR